MRVLIIYDSKYGNTEIVAENILAGIKQVEGIESAICNTKEVVSQTIANYDALILGSPNHMANPSRTMKKFVDKLAELNLKPKSLVVFGTYSGRARASDRAVKKLEKIVERKLPNLKLILPSLSVKVKGVTGPVIDGELQRCQDFGRRIANQLFYPKA